MGAASVGPKVARPVAIESMKRRWFSILSILSLLVFVAVVVMWVRSQDMGARVHRRFVVRSGSHIAYIVSVGATALT